MRRAVVPGASAPGVLRREAPEALAPPLGGRWRGAGGAAPVRRVLAVASGGGHWLQLMQMRPAFAAAEVSFATTLPGLAAQAGIARAHLLPDCNRDTPLRILLCALALLALLVRERPAVVISTGALPGYIALRLAKALGARTIWVDSIANAEEMSLAGQRVRPYADLWLSQWPHVARAAGAEHAGAVL